MKKLNYTKIKEHLIEWMKDYAISNNMEGFVIGVSGGIDSGVVSTLCAETGLPLLTLEMPIHQASDQVTRAKKHIMWLKENYPNVTSVTVDLTDTYEAFKNAGVKVVDDEAKYEFSLSNSRSRLRMTTLYQYAGQLNRLVAGTGNKVEDFGIGFFTKGGDGMIDISPIGDLMKSEVYALGAELGLIQEILNAVPTDGLHDDGRTDEDQLKCTYSELEWAMYFEDDNINTTSGECEDKLSIREKEVLEIYRNRHNANLHKMSPAPVFNTSEYRN